MTLVAADFFKCWRDISIIFLKLKLNPFWFRRNESLPGNHSKFHYNPVHHTAQEDRDKDRDKKSFGRLLYAP